MGRRWHFKWWNTHLFGWNELTLNLKIIFLLWNPAFLLSKKAFSFLKALYAKMYSYIAPWKLPFHNFWDLALSFLPAIYPCPFYCRLSSWTHCPIYRSFSKTDHSPISQSNLLPGTFSCRMWRSGPDKWTVYFPVFSHTFFNWRLSICCASHFQI